jgi:CubicO group peptidase (beta-lactamase class C family)
METHELFALNRDQHLFLLAILLLTMDTKLSTPTNSCYYMKSKSVLLAVCFCGFMFVSQGQILLNILDGAAEGNDMMGGSVVVHCGDSIIERWHYGTADLEREIPVGPQTKYRIASVSKMVTAIAVMQLMDAGAINLDDDISDILGYDVVNPNYPETPITVSMLLSHTSGIIDGTTYSDFLGATVNDDPIPNLSEILTTVGDYYTTNQFNNIEPGTYFNYSNINYVILGTIIEKAADQRFDAYCREHIFEPLGLDASFNVNDLQNIDDVAVLYRKISDVWTPQADDYQGVQPVFNNLDGYIPGTNGGRFGPQGGLRISAEDLSKISMCLMMPGSCEALNLTTTSISLMLLAQWTYDGENGNNYYGLFRSWGLGIHLITSTPGNDIVLPGSNTMYGHTGEAYGLVSDVYFDPQRNVGIVFITNGVGNGYQLNKFSGFYSVEQEIFGAIENYGNIGNCATIHIPEKENPSLRMYPNPADDIITISTSSTHFNAPVRILTTDGKIIREVKAALSGMTMDLSDLPEGVYIISLAEQQLKFVKCNK